MYTPKDPIVKTNLMLDLVSQRQRALATNLANVDTPNYVRKDINFDQYLGTMNNPLETELSIKLGPSGLIDEQGVGVDATYELAEMQKMNLLYAVASRKMSCVINEMKTVIAVGR
jgi:flagellar basal-body rod protein FlgB